MSAQAAAEFWSRAQTDESLTQRLAETVNSTNDVLAAVRQLGERAGFQFTVDELTTIIRSDGIRSELSDRELDSVAGGIGMLLPAVQKVREAALLGARDELFQKVR